MPIAQDAADAYMRDCPGATINVTDGDSAYGLSTVRQAVASGSSSAGSMIAMYDGFPSATYTAGLRPYPMGVLIFSVVAHAGLFAASNITADELRKIFVKPGEQGKVAVGRRAGSGSREAFDTHVLGLNPGQPDRGNCPQPTGGIVSFTHCTEDSTADLLNFVSMTPNAIGYAELSRPHADYPQLSVLSVDNAAPTPDNVANGSYRFWTVEHLYAATQPAMLTTDFLDFLSHYKGPNLPPDFIPCSDALKRVGADC
jgi:ABC-type phosphate transport system substrate-binding protein